jgi:hypothetical protein
MKTFWRGIIFATFFFSVLQLIVLGYSYSTAKRIVFQRASEGSFPFLSNSCYTFTDHKFSVGPQMTNQLFDLLEQRKDAQHSVTITFTNIGNVKMTQNFMVELAKVGIRNWIVVSFDAESCEILGEFCYHDISKNFNLDKVPPPPPPFIFLFFF